MSVYTPHFAPIVLLAFLGTAALLILCLLLAIVGALRKSRRVLAGGIAAALVVGVGYAAVLLGLSLGSRNIEIAQGAWKYFCEIDCHIAYAIGDLQLAASVGPEMQAITSNGQFAIVPLKTWFDPSTISPHRGNGPLTPNARDIVLVDDRGRNFAPSAKSRAVLAAAGLHSTPFRTWLRPGDSYVSYIVFEIPRDAKGLKLLITTSGEGTSLIWGDENSPFHQKAYFVLPRIQESRP